MKVKLGCVIKETISTWIKILLSLKIVTQIAVVIGIGIIATMGIIQLFRIISEQLEVIIATITSAINWVTQYFIAVPLWIWGCIAAVWILLGAVPVYSYIKCYLKELPDEKRQGLITELYYWAMFGGITGGVFGAFGWVVSETSYRNALSFALWVVAGIIIGFIIGVIMVFAIIHDSAKMEKKLEGIIIKLGDS